MYEKPIGYSQNYHCNLGVTVSGDGCTDKGAADRSSAWVCSEVEIVRGGRVAIEIDNLLTLFDTEGSRVTN